MAQILKIDDEQIITENGRKIRRFIFNDDKIVKVDLDENVITEDVSEKYLNLISIYYVSSKKVNTKVSAKVNLIKKGLSGIGGWLIVYIVILSLGIIASIVGAMSNNISSSDCSALNSYYSGACDALQPIFALENFAVVLIIILDMVVLVMIFMRKKLAIMLAMIAAIVTLSWNILDAFIVSQGFIGYFSSSVISETIVGQVPLIVGNAIFCGIWIPYFLRSERVKATLVKATLINI